MPEWIGMFFDTIIVFSSMYLEMHIVLRANGHIKRKSILNEIHPFAKVNISQYLWLFC